MPLWDWGVEGGGGGEIKQWTEANANESDFRSSSAIRLLAPRSVEKTLFIYFIYLFIFIIGI